MLDLCSAGASRIGCGGEGEANRAKKGGDGEVSEKSLGMRYFQAFAHLEEPEVAPSWAAGVARDGRNEKNGSNGSGWEYNCCWPGSRKGNPGLQAGVVFGAESAVRAAKKRSWEP